jgi:hypothetical protein
MKWGPESYGSGECTPDRRKRGTRLEGEPYLRFGRTAQKESRDLAGPDNIGLGPILTTLACSKGAEQLQKVSGQKRDIIWLKF